MYWACNLKYLFDAYLMYIFILLRIFSGSILAKHNKQATSNNKTNRMNRNLYHVPRSVLNRYVYLILMLGFGLLNPLMAQQSFTFSGKVTDKNGETLPGVNVGV